MSSRIPSTRSPFVVHPERVPATRSRRSSTGEPLGWVRSLVDEDGIGMRVGRIDLPPGERVAPEHAHSHLDEIFVVLEGEVTPVVGGIEKEPIGPGAVLVVPAGAELTSTLRNRGPAHARLLQVACGIEEDVVRFADEDGSAES